MRPADHQEYADDTILSLEPQNSQEITTQLTNYQGVTEGRQIPIQRKNRKTNREKTQTEIHYLLLSTNRI